MQILKVRFRTNSEFEANYQGDLMSGGLFCPTTAPLDRGEPVIVELSAPALPNKVLIRGTVRSWRPALPRLRVRAGAVVDHTRLPVAVPVRYRTSESAELFESSLSEISVGGAMLATPAPLPLETDVILEITPPGAVRPISISGKATYHLPSGSTGLKFLYRDAGGSRRLRELVRRLRQS